MQMNVEACCHIFLNFLTELLYFCSCGLSQVDQHQGLQRMHSGVSQSFAFPSALLDEPSCRHFDASFGGVVGDVRMLRLQLTELCFADDRVHKERACAADFFRVRQFLTSYANHFVANFRGCRWCGAIFGKAFQCSV